MDKPQEQEQKSNYPQQYIEALNEAIRELNEDLYEYREEMRIYG